MQRLWVQRMCIGMIALTVFSACSQLTPVQEIRRDLGVRGERFIGLTVPKNQQGERLKLVASERNGDYRYFASLLQEARVSGNSVVLIADSDMRQRLDALRSTVCQLPDYTWTAAELDASIVIGVWCSPTVDRTIVIPPGVKRPVEVQYFVQLLETTVDPTTFQFRPR